MAPRFSVLIWAGIAIGLLLGCSGFYACDYVSRHLRVEWSPLPAAVQWGSE